MSPEDFDFISKLVKERSGLVLTRDKGYLVENRLLPVVRTNRFKSATELLAMVRNGNSELVDKVIDAMMTKDTAFFRDWLPFEHFRKVVLPNLIKRRTSTRTFRILCAGVSTGQEAFSLAMLVRDYGGELNGWKVEIVGVDISRSALSAAQLGTFSQFDVQRGLPIRTLLKHFTRRDEAWTLNGDVQGMVGFMHWNLLDDIFPLGRFDVVMCRNILTAFDLQTKFAVLQKLSRAAHDDGVLYVGAKEPMNGISSMFKPIDAELGVHAVNRTERNAIRSLAS